VINSIGGLLWNDKSTFDEDCSASLCRLILYLKTLLRHSLAVIMITVPNEILHNVSLMQKLSHLSDFVFSMDDSKSTASKLTKTEYDGLFRLSKLPCLNSLSSFQPETLDLAFYLKRKRLVVEQLHLPPDLGEGDETQKGRTSSAATMSCSSSSGSTTSAKAKLLDF
jgi:elongator complex protein 4